MDHTFHHPSRLEIDDFQAERLSCDPAAVRSGGTAVLRRERDPGGLSLFEAPGGSVVVISGVAAPSLARAVDRIPTGLRATADDFTRLQDPGLRVRGVRDLTFYLDPARFRPTAADGVRPAAAEDVRYLEVLQAAVREHEREYVRIDHAGLFLCTRGGAVVSAASHLPEKRHRITDLGVLTHPAHRRQRLGQAVVSAAIRWAHKRRLVCQRVTTDANRASVALARSLGFELYGRETELTIA